MKFSQFLFSFLVILSLFILSCQTQQQQQHYFGMSVMPSSEEIIKFWTPERMRSAIPIPFPVVPRQSSRHNNNNRNKTAQHQSTVRPQNTQLVDVPYSYSPYQSTGKLFLWTGSYYASCTASHIGNNKILAAGHCVFGSGNFYSNFMFVPQYKLEEAPLGVFTGARVYTTSEWMNGGGYAMGRDVGIVVVNDYAGRNLQQTCGSYGVTYNSNGNLPVLALGYPENMGDTLQLVQATSNEGPGNSQFSPPTLSILSTMNFGASGGPWIYNGNLINGINSYIDGDGVHVFGPYFDSYIETFISNSN